MEEPHLGRSKEQKGSFMANRFVEILQTCIKRSNRTKRFATQAPFSSRRVHQLCEMQEGTQVSAKD